MLRIGTCSWKFPSWEGLVYAPGDEENYLAAYAKRYRTVEVDQWFWSLFDIENPTLPNPQTAREYAAAVDADFRFTIKAPNSITLTHLYRHARENAGAENPHFLSADLLNRTLERIQPLRAQCDAVMLQFEYLNRQKMAGVDQLIARLDPFLEAVTDGWPLAIELRNKQYLNADWFDFLASRGVAHVFCDGYYMPPAVEVWRRHGSRLVPRAVVRLLGPDRKGIEERTGKRWDERLEPRDDELRAAAQMTREMLEREMEVTVNVNNHYEGSAPRTIAVFQNFLEV